MKDPKQIREKAMADLRHTFRMVKKYEAYGRGYKARLAERKARYNTAREIALNWGVLNLIELAALEHEVENGK